MTNVGEILCNCVPYPIHVVNGTTVYVSLCMVQDPLSVALYPGVWGGKRTPGNYCLRMHVIKRLLLCNTTAVTNLMGWVSIVTQTYNSLTVCTVPSMASAPFQDVVTAN